MTSAHSVDVDIDGVVSVTRFKEVNCVESSLLNGFQMSGAMSMNDLELDLQVPSVVIDHFEARSRNLKILADYMEYERPSSMEVILRPISLLSHHLHKGCLVNPI